MKKLYFTALLGFSMFAIPVLGQQTVGLFTYDTLIADSYTLLAPAGSKTTYLINNCGHEVKSWTSDFPPGLSAVLTESGHLVRAGAVANSEFSHAGGFGGVIEKFDWNGNLVWQFVLSNDSISFHHDFKILPNGNILALAWKTVDEARAIVNGRDPMMITEQRIWEEVIYELKPTGSNGAEIVWEWHSMDHLVQNRYNTKKNYGVVSANPQLFDINSALIEDRTDWLHFNSVDYNEELDQILVSGRTFSEIYIIDHSTSVEESSGHFGGLSNKGGDLLYRWGNPSAYDRGSVTDQKSFQQHDATWIPKGYSNEGKILFFNNGTNRKFSTAEIFSPPLNLSTGSYTLEGNKAYQPSVSQKIYQSANPEDFFSANMGGVRRMKNGNTILTESTQGRVLEINKYGEVVWEYIVPVNTNGKIKQGFKPTGNSVFRALKYPADYGAFNGKSLVDGKPLEINPLFIHCDDTTGKNVGPGDTTSNFVHGILLSGYTLYPNPTQNVFQIIAPPNGSFSWQLFAASGALLLEEKNVVKQSTISLDNQQSGVYAVFIFDCISGIYTVKKIVKQ